MDEITVENEDFMEHLEQAKQLEDLKWSNRRRIAYTSLYAVLSIVAVLFVFAVVDAIFKLTIIDQVGKFSEIVVTVIFGLISLIGAYMGLASVYGSNTKLNLTGKFSNTGSANTELEEPAETPADEEPAAKAKPAVKSSIASRIKTE